PLPLGMAVAIPHPLPRFGTKGISPSAEGDQRASRPLETSPAALSWISYAAAPPQKKPLLVLL
ncbi:MAG: hypothetical protein NC395_10915, partial [Prevotella sp.]|nr:hypothetical protein [Prevotella sp.]